MSDAHLRRLLDRTEDLYVFPTVAARVMAVARDPQSDLGDMEEVVASDPVLAARLLEMANSAYFGRGGRVASLRRAIQRLGFQRTRSAAVGLALSGLGKEASPAGRVLWSHAVRSGEAARALAPHLPREVATGLFLGALLHTIGRQLMAVLDAEGMEQVLEAEGSGHPDVEALEQAAFGVTSAALGAACLERWHFDAKLVDAVAHWRDPVGELLGEGLRRLVAGIQVADAFARALDATSQIEGLVTVVASEPGCRVLGLPRATLAAVAADLATPQRTRRAA